MALLDSFVLLFEADAAKLNDGVDKAKKKTETLVDKLKDADKRSELVGDKFRELVSTAGGALMAMIAVHSVSAGAKEAFDFTTQLNNSSEALGINIGEMEAWAAVAESLGGDSQGMADSFTDMAEAMGEALKDVESEKAKTFKSLKMSLKDAKGDSIDAVEGLLRLSDAVDGMSKQEAIFRIKQVGITDNKTVAMVLKGRSALEEMIATQKEAGGITEEQAEQVKEMNGVYASFSRTLRWLYLDIGIGFAPALKLMIELFKKMVSFFKSHSDFVIAALTGIGIAISAFVLPGLISMATAAFIAFLPFLLIGAAIAGVIALFALLYEDITAFRNGSDSMIGEIAKKWPIVGDVVNGLVDTIKYFVDFTAAAFGLLADMIFDPANAWDNFVGKITGGIETVRGHFPFLFGLIDGLANGFVTMGDVIMGVWDAIVATIMGAIDSVKGAVSDIQDFFGIGGGDVKVAKTAITSANQSPLNQQSSAAISNSRNVAQNSTVNVQKVEVKTQATDAQGISRAIGGEMKAQLKRATSNYDDGVLA